MSDQSRRKGLRDRLIGLLLLIPSAAVLTVARWLTPDPSGVGTHQQLGMASCAVLERMAVPCPMCGMTTTFSLMAHFRPLSAVMNQPFGVVLFLITVVLAVVGLAELVRPGKLLRRLVLWTLDRDLALAGTLLAMMIAAWVYKIALMREMLPWGP